MSNTSVPYVNPTIIAPTSASVATQATTALPGISVQDSYEAAAGTPMTVVLSDLAGLLSVSPVAGLQESGVGSMNVTLTGPVGAIDAALGSLVYDEPFARMPFDFLSVAATDDHGVTQYSQIQVGPGGQAGSILAGDGGPVSVPLDLPGALPNAVPGQVLGDNGQSSSIQGGAGNDTIIASSGNDTISTGTGSNLVGLGTGADLLYSMGNDTIIGGTQTDTVFAAGNSLTFAGNGGLVFINGSGSAIVIGGTGTGSDIINGGQGGGLFAGGSSGNNVIIAGQQSSTIFGAGSGDLLMAAGPSADMLIAGAGNETLTGVGSSGANTFYAGSGADLLGGGSGNETFIGGTGSETVIGGSGADMYGLVAGLSSGGNDLIYGFDAGKGDSILLAGYGAGEQAQALATQQSGSGGTMLTLSDNTHVTFVGVAGLTNADFA